MHLRRSLHHRLYVLFCLFANHDGHKREQTSCRVFGTELKTNRNTEARICCYSYLWAACGVAALCHILDYRITFWYGCPITLFCLQCPFNRLVHKDFSALSVSIALRCKVMSKNSRTQKNILNIPQYRKAVYSALWVQLALSICFSPHS